jgi:hypothetical protein
VGEAEGDLIPPCHHLLVHEVSSRCLARDYNVAVVDSLLRGSTKAVTSEAKVSD